MMSRLKVLMAAALLVGGAAACSDVTGANAAADGNYTLSTVNGNSLPFTTQDGAGNTIVLQSDSYVLNSDGSYTEQGAFTTNGQQGSRIETGFWTQSNSVVQFTPDQTTSGSYLGTLSGGGTFGGGRTLSISISGTTAVYVQN